jgi:cyclopropane-fatty-acyl-phospholipid synthase
MIVAPGNSELQHIPYMDEYSAANAFINGKLTVHGDLCSAIRFFGRQQRPLVRELWFSVGARLKQVADSLLNGRDTRARNIRFHYDRSNEFYRQFLDSRMLYSAADFSDPSSSLEEAQAKKLDGICRKLDLRPNQRFLDVGCGWGALVIDAAERFGVNAVGCTLSHNQLEFARAVVKDHGLDRRVTIEEIDYRDIQGCFDKIASVGMFEHVGRKLLSGYFSKLYSLLDDRGLFLNRGIVRPETTSVGPATLFLQRKVFPGGGLVHLADVVREAEQAGFGVLEVQDLRQDYALTCRAWVNRLVQHAETCIALVGEATYRTWLLYLAASAVNFEDGVTDAVQATFEKRRKTHAP